LKEFMKEAGEEGGKQEDGAKGKTEGEKKEGHDEL
jgi:hypothetical protein